MCESGPLCRAQLGDERFDRGTHPLGRFHKLDTGLVDELSLFSATRAWVTRPLTTTNVAPSASRKSWSEPGCSGNEVSIWVPPGEISMMVIG